VRRGGAGFECCWGCGARGGSGEFEKPRSDSRSVLLTFCSD
jgi:hypothetical protein